MCCTSTAQTEGHHEDVSSNECPVLHCVKQSLCCSTLYQSQITSPAQSSRTELNTLKANDVESMMPKLWSQKQCWPFLPWLQIGLSSVPASALQLQAAAPGGHTEFGCRFLLHSWPRRYLHSYNYFVVPWNCFAKELKMSGTKTNKSNAELTQSPLWVIFHQFALIDCPDPQLTLYSCDKWRSLKQSTSECLQCLQRNVWLHEITHLLWD